MKNEDHKWIECPKKRKHRYKVATINILLFAIWIACFYLKAPISVTIPLYWAMAITFVITIQT